MREFRQNANYNDILNQGAEEGQTETESTNGGGNHGNRYSLPYGLCASEGINTDGMTPREAWDAWTSKTGRTKEDAEREHWGGKDNSAQTDESIDKNQDKRYNESVQKMLNDPRIVESKSFNKQKLKTNLESGTPEVRNLTVELFNGDSFGYRDNERNTAYYGGFNKVCLKNKDLSDEEHYAKGEVFYHETWHAIDFNYGEKSKGRYDFKTLSNNYVLNNGITFSDTLMQEADSEINWSEVKKQIQIERDEYYKEQGIDVQFTQQQYEELTLRLKSFSVLPVDERIKKRKELLDLDETKQIIEKFSEISKIPSKIRIKYSNLSDVFSGCTNGRETLVGMGHSSSDWRVPGARGREAFAECASTKATNPESYQVLKKYLPKTVSAFEEIFKKLKTGEIKSSERPKYQA